MGATQAREGGTQRWSIGGEREELPESSTGVEHGQQVSAGSSHATENNLLLLSFLLMKLYILHNNVRLVCKVSSLPYILSVSESTFQTPYFKLRSLNKHKCYSPFGSKSVFPQWFSEEAGPKIPEAQAESRFVPYQLKISHMEDRIAKSTLA